MSIHIFNKLKAKNVNVAYAAKINGCFQMEKNRKKEQGKNRVLHWLVSRQTSVAIQICLVKLLRHNP